MLGSREIELEFKRRCRHLKSILKIGGRYELFIASADDKLGRTRRYKKGKCIVITPHLAVFEFDGKIGCWREAFTFPELLKDAKIREAW